MQPSNDPAFAVPSTVTEAEVRQTFEEFLAALKNGDQDTLMRIYADDYLLVRPDGTTLTKKEILDDLKRHAIIFTSVETAHALLKTEGTVAVLALESRSFFVRDGQQGQMHAQQVIVFRKTSGGITITHLQSTTIG